MTCRFPGHEIPFGGSPMPAGKEIGKNRSSPQGRAGVLPSVPHVLQALSTFLLPWRHQVVKDASTVESMAIRRAPHNNLKHHRSVIWAINLLNPIPRKPVKSRPRKPRLSLPSRRPQLPNRLLQRRSRSRCHGAAASRSRALFCVGLVRIFPGGSLKFQFRVPCSPLFVRGREP